MMPQAPKLHFLSSDHSLASKALAQSLALKTRWQGYRGTLALPHALALHIAQSLAKADDAPSFVLLALSPDPKATAPLPPLQEYKELLHELRSAGHVPLMVLMPHPQAQALPSDFEQDCLTLADQLGVLHWNLAKILRDRLTQGAPRAALMQGGDITADLCDILSDHLAMALRRLTLSLPQRASCYQKLRSWRLVPAGAKPPKLSPDEQISHLLYAPAPPCGAQPYDDPIFGAAAYSPSADQNLQEHAVKGILITSHDLSAQHSPTEIYHDLPLNLARWVETAPLQAAIDQLYLPTERPSLALIGSRRFGQMLAAPYHGQIKHRIWDKAGRILARDSDAEFTALKAAQAHMLIIDFQPEAQDLWCKDGKALTPQEISNDAMAEGFALQSPFTPEAIRRSKAAWKSIFTTLGTGFAPSNIIILKTIPSLSPPEDSAQQRQLDLLCADLASLAKEVLPACQVLDEKSDIGLVQALLQPRRKPLHKTDPAQTEPAQTAPSQTAPSQPNQPKMAIYGNYYGLGLSQVVNLAPELGKTYDHIPLKWLPDLTAQERDTWLQEHAGQTKVLLYQFQKHNPASVNAKLSAILEAISKDALALSWRPSVYFGYEPHLAVPFGLPANPISGQVNYLHVMAYLGGRPWQQVLEFYTDPQLLSADFVKDNHRRAQTLYAKLEADCDLRIAPYLVENCFKERLHFTPLTAAPALFRATMAQALARMGLAQDVGVQKWSLYPPKSALPLLGAFDIAQETPSSAPVKNAFVIKEKTLSAEEYFTQWQAVFDSYGREKLHQDLKRQLRENEFVRGLLQQAAPKMGLTLEL